jgi:hypothetical protein
MVPWNVIMGAWNMNREPCIVSIGPRNVIMRSRNVIMGPWNVNRGPGM